MKEVRVYIAGPYSKGDVVENIRNAVLIADYVLELGMIPFIPHLIYLWHIISCGYLANLLGLTRKSKRR